MASFFSTGGTCSRRAFLTWTALALVLFLIALMLLTRVGGYAASIAAGLLAGVALAKLRAEAMCRLREAGLGAGPMFALGLALPTTGLLALLWSYAHGFDSIFTGFVIAGAAGIAVPALLPRRYDPTGLSGRSGMAAAAVVILAGVALGYTAAAWSDASRQMHDDQAERAADYVPPPDPLASPDAGNSGAEQPR